MCPGALPHPADPRTFAAMLTPLRRGLSPAVQSLGLGDALAQQVQDETDEERKRRLSRQQQMSMLGPAAVSLGLTGTTTAGLGG